MKIADVFRDFYAVPNYQREYIWEHEQVDQLLHDVRAEQLNSGNSDYFIGSIVVCPGKLDRFDLIDGQQRITTLFITLCALRDRLQSLGENTSTIRKLIADDTAGVDGVDRFQPRLDPQYADAGDVFKKLVDGTAPDPKAATRSMSNVAGAYEAALAFLVDEFGIDVTALRGFYGYLINKVTLIRIKTDSIARALKIFETINDRGISLDAMDLLKNLLFMKADRSQFEQLKDRWKALTDKLYRAREKPLRFLRYYLSATYGLVKLQEDELYDWLVKHEEEVGYASNPLGFVSALTEALDAYVNFLNGRGPDGREHRNVSALSLLAGKSTRQHLVVLLGARCLPDEIFSEVCKDAENLVFVYLVTRVPSREFEVTFPSWAVDIALVKSLDDYRALSLKTFRRRRAELAARFEREFALIDCRSFKQFQLRYLLAKLTQYVDLAAYGQNSAGHRWLSRYCDGGANQIEHILPQTPTDLVRQEFGQGVDDPSLLWSIGNLALVESSINQSLGNLPFSHKRSVYPKSQLLLTRTISEKLGIGETAIDRAVESLLPFDVWNAQSVNQRASILTYIAKKVWDVTTVEGVINHSAPKSAEPLKSSETKSAVPRTRQATARVKAEADVRQSIPAATFAGHLEKADSVRQEILLRLRERVMALGCDVIEKATPANRVAYRRSRVFLEIKIHKDRVRILFLDVPLHDSRNVIVSVPVSHGWGRLKNLMNLSSIDDLTYAMPFIKAAYDDARS